MKSVLLQHRVKQKHLRLRRFAVRFGIFFVLGGGGILFLLLSPRFQLGPITLSGNATVPSEEITTAAGAFFGERVAWFFSRGNMLLFRSNALESYMLKEFPRLASADVKRSFSQELALHVLERAPWGLYCKHVERDCYYIAEDGVLTAEAPQLTGSAMFRVIDKRSLSAFFLLGDRAIEEFETVFLRQIVYLLKDRYEVTVQEVILGRMFQDQTELLTNEGWYVLFDERTNKKRALENLTLVLDQHLTDRSTLEYVDIRFEGKVFYKER